MKKFKAIAGWLHLWIGLVTGVIVVIVSVTGCIQVFDEELFSLFHHDLVKVQQTGPARPVSELLAVAQKAVGKKKQMTDLKITGDDHSYVFTASKANKKEDVGISYFSQAKYQDDIYINQYTGAVLGIIDARYEFFNVVEQLHRQLLLTKPVGSVIIGSAILLFLIMMITGFIIWLPKNYKQFKQSITVKWSAKWKRVNYDLHSSLGFYVLPIAIIIAITGLVWSFKWWETGMFKVLGTSGKITLLRAAPVVATGDTTNTKIIDVIYVNLLHQIGDNYKVIGFNLPEKKSNTVMVFTYVKRTTDSWNNMSYFYFDKRTGKMFDKLEHQDKPLALKWRNSNKYIHTGRIFGWPTQIMAFLAALICASLPITGFLIWWGKRNKKNKKGSVKRAQPVLS
ncbi:PepSY-associated TM helix domain-containing protein [Mucilaginibacter aquaedulcis]|uniref:PepSY-associated TM helix domain-containing protein n=1 Tax=Mucilaginibacter aquaedulcis TaxID=1187081 RepID=UPI0025B2CBD3|nr:PepSY-associated TM helix domain-containing protein [Mucilaginibacter aquaedulcis]MDN3549963.1 PepSY-associated TM helix domain-containing protein [Mucilaginibacter aquaedulcis]